LRDVFRVFEWAINHEHYSGDNPVKGLLLKEKKGIRKRKPYTDEELSLIFQSAEFHRQLKEHPDRYFIPLILLHTGARLGEVAQLGVNDMKQSADGIWSSTSTGTQS
jgi:integrase